MIIFNKTYCSKAQSYRGWTRTLALKQYHPRGSDSMLVMLSGYNQTYQCNSSYNRLYKLVNALSSEHSRNQRCSQIQPSLLKTEARIGLPVGRRSCKTGPLFLTNQLRHFSLQDMSPLQGLQDDLWKWGKIHDFILLRLSY